MPMNKIYLFPYSGYGGKMFLVKAKTLKSAKNKMKKFLTDKDFTLEDIGDAVEAEFNHSIAELGYFGE